MLDELKLVIVEHLGLNIETAHAYVLAIIEAADRTIGVTQARGAYTQVLGINLKTSA